VQFYLQAFQMFRSLLDIKTNIAIYNEKTLRETQTLRAGCSKPDPKIVAPPQNPFPGARDDQI